MVEYGLKLIAIGTVPENRRPASSSAWLLLILFLPVIGFPLYWLIGSPYVRGRRHRIQDEVNRGLVEGREHLPGAPADAVADPGLASVLQMNQRLTGLPFTSGTHEAIYPDTAAFFAALAAAIDEAREFVHVEFYIVSWDEATAPVFEALARASARGVETRLLMDHLGSRKYPGRKQLGGRLTAAGIEWHLMMPIKPLERRWRRPDLRNHRKLVVIDGERAFLGSHNLIAPSYGSAKNIASGRAWSDVSLQVSGEIVASASIVFATDWYTETGEMFVSDRYLRVPAPSAVGGPGHAMQLVPSGPGYPTEPNLRLFTSLINHATSRVAITSPYFVPDDSLLAAITTAAYRGVEVELFVGEQADQFLVGHAQRSYYAALLEAGVTIHLYPPPTVLHAKYLTVDDRIAVIGSSNMDFRSFALTYEVMLLAFGGDLVDRLQRNDADYRSVSRVLTREEWQQRPWRQRYVDNVCRLTAALM